MKLKYYIAIFLNIVPIWTDAQFLSDNIRECEWFNLLAINIFHILQSNYQAIVILLNESRFISEHNDLIHRISQRYPLTILNPVELQRIPVLRRTRNVVTYIFLTSATDEESFLRFYLYRFNRGFAQRAKCLIVHFDNGIQLINFENIMRYGWSVKFLDLTIININVKEKCYNPVVHYYNPFFNKTHNNMFDASTDIFPDKLLDVNGYEFIVDLYHAKFTRDIYGNLKSDYYLDKTVLPVISIALQKINVTLLPDEVYYSGVKTGYINLKRLAYRRTATRPTKLQVFDNAKKVIAVVPKRRILMLSNMYQILIHVGILIIVIIIGSSVNKILRYNSAYWDALNILQQLIGGSSFISPKSLIQKIFMIYFGFLSYYYSNEFYSSLIEAQLSFETISYDTYQEIYESKFRIRMESEYKYKIITNSKLSIEDMYYNKILNKSYIMDRGNEKDCMETIYLNGNEICVMHEALALDLLKKHLNYESVMRIANPAMGYTYETFHLDYNSPFHIKLQKIIYRIAESGITQLYENREIRKDNDIFSNDESQFILKLLIFILITGYTSAIVVFLFQITFIF